MRATIRRSADPAVKPGSSLCPGDEHRSLRIEQHLRAAKERDRFPIGFARDDGVPDLRRATEVNAARGGSDRSLERGADEIALELDRREAGGAFGKIDHAAVA